MKKIVSKLLLFFICSMNSSLLFAQDDKSGIDGLMRNNGKIYVVVAVCLTILIGLFIYVFVLDRKISRLEKNKD